jgi:transcriptional regulator with XRE-family HTH domain
MTSQEYLDAVRVKLGLTSDYGLAKALGVTRQAASRWSNGKNGFDDTTAERVAAILGINPAFVILDIHKERAQNASTRRIWDDIQEGFHVPLPHANRVTRRSHLPR